jgi:uncharacterized protein
MLAVVFDVNILVSAIILKTGKPRDLWLKAVESEFTLRLSDQIVFEFRNVVSRKKFAKYVTKHDIQVFTDALDRTAEFIKVESTFSFLEEDPDDDLILRTAYDGNADYIVSGDRHLLSLEGFRGIKIVTIDNFLKVLENKS